MIPEPKGRELTSLLERNVTVTMIITIGTRNLQKYVSRTSVVFVSISFIVLMIISLAWLVFYYIQRFRYANARDRNQVCTHFLTSGRISVRCIFYPLTHRSTLDTHIDRTVKASRISSVATERSKGHQFRILIWRKSKKTHNCSHRGEI